MLLDVLCFFNRKNLTIVGSERFTDDSVMYHYKYGSRNYSSIGVVHGPPPSGVCLPVSKAMCDRQDITDRFVTFAGPKCNHVPDTGYMLYKRIPWFRISFPGRLRIEFTMAPHKGPSRPITVTNIIGQESVFGAD